MAEALVENGLEATNHLVDRYFDKGWDRVKEFRNGRKTKDQTTPYQSKRRTASSSSSSSSGDRIGERTPAQSATARRRGVSRTAAGVGAGAALGATTVTAGNYPGARRRQRNSLPSPERDIDRDYRRDSIRSLQQESETSDRVLREYELETDDPKRHPATVLPEKDLRSLKGDTKRDSAMASGYRDDYQASHAGYAGEASRPRSQPPRSRYYDDDDSDYDERSGRRYGKGNGRGYDDDREYDVVREETERYRGPPANRPWDSERKQSYRSEYDGPYGAGAVTQYGRRSDGALDRQESYVSRRTKSRGRDRDDRSYSRSASRSRSRSRSNEGWQEKIGEHFDTSARGLGVGLAGAVIGGLAGREFGHKHRQRDIILGAVVGGLGANAAETKWRDWKEGRETEKEGRYEQRYDGRSRSNVR